MTRVRSEMTRKVILAHESDDIRQAYMSMKSLNVRHVPVVRDRKVVGILSDRDILARATLAKDGEMRVPPKPVGEVMTGEVITCREMDTIGECIDKLLENKIGALPVVDEKERLVGILTTTDLLRLLREQDWDTKQSIPFRWDPVPVAEQWRSWRPEPS